MSSFGHPEGGHEPSRFLWHQLVSACFCHQDRWAGSILLDLLAQPINMRFERMGGDAGIVAPYFLQQSLARNRALAGAIQVTQDRGLLLRETDFVALGIEQDLGAGEKGIGPDAEYG